MPGSDVARLLMLLVAVAALAMPSLALAGGGRAEAAGSVGLAQTTPDAGLPWDARPAPADRQLGDPGDANGRDARLLVRFRPTAAPAAQDAAHRAAGALGPERLGTTGITRVRVPSADAPRVLAEYRDRADVAWAEPDHRVRAFLTPNDPLFAQQWGLAQIGAPRAWERPSGGGAAVRVAILDCGIFGAGSGRLAADGQPGHPDLRGAVALERDFTGSASGADDRCNHGSHVAGIVAARTGNGLGVAGMGSGLDLLNGKVLDDGGWGFTSDVAAGIVWSADNGAKVVNLSLGREGACSNAEQEAVDYAWERGVVVIAAAGNQGARAVDAPASCARVVAVGSTTRGDNRSSFSNYGPGVHVGAPGSSILSTTNDGEYAYFSGTSMAAPHVAGLVGLAWSVAPSATAQAVVENLTRTADRVEGTGLDWVFGRVNAAAALGVAAPAPTATAPAPTSTATAPVPTATVPAPTATPVVLTPTSTSVPPTPVATAPVPTPPAATACAPSRPRVGVASVPLTRDAMAVTMSAGLGTISRVTVTEVRNATVAIGGRPDVTGPYEYTPVVNSPDLTFTIVRRSANAPWQVALVIEDDCGPWPTFVGTS